MERKLPYLCLMNATELIIIYLACGSPFCVYEAANRRDVLTPNLIATLLFHFLLWPVAAVRRLVRMAASGSSSGASGLDRSVEQIRFEIENLAFTEGTAAGVFEFREVFDRFVGLSIAAAGDAVGGQLTELMTISGHAKPELASRCADRRNGERLVFHQLRARNEFVELIADLARSSVHSNKIVLSAQHLATLLRDTDALDDLSLLVSENLPRPSPCPIEKNRLTVAEQK
jgi:hypothetical protein